MALRKHAIRIPIPADPPSEFVLIHQGVNPSENGDYLFDEESAKTVMEAAGRRGIRYYFDYCHSSLDENPVDPENAGKAAGQFTLEVRNGDLWATAINWTPAAERHIANHEYTYFSPAFESDDEGHVFELWNCALTNDPATHQIEQLVAAEKKLPANSSTTAASRNLKNDEGQMTEEEAKKLGALEQQLEEAHKTNKALEKRLRKLEEADGGDDEDDDEVKPQARQEEATEESKEEDEDGEDDDEEECNPSKQEAEEEGKVRRMSRSLTRRQLSKIVLQQAKDLHGIKLETHTRNVSRAVKAGRLEPYMRDWALTHPKGFSALLEGRGDHKVVRQSYTPDDEASEKQDREVHKQTRSAASPNIVKMAKAIGVDPEVLAKKAAERPLGTQPSFSAEADQEDK